jgi:hypothetical protein
MACNQHLHKSMITPSVRTSVIKTCIIELTKLSPTSGAGNIGEPRVMTQVRGV